MRLPENFATVEASFSLYAARVKTLFEAAGSDTNWRAIINDVNELRTHYAAVEVGIMATPSGKPTWNGRGTPGPVWDVFTRLGGRNDNCQPT